MNKEFKMNQDKPNPKIPTINILTSEEKSSYRAFAHRIKELDHASLFKLNNDRNLYNIFNCISLLFI